MLKENEVLSKVLNRASRYDKEPYEEPFKVLGIRFDPAILNEKDKKVFNRMKINNGRNIYTGTSSLI